MSVKTASLGKTSDSGRIEFTWVSTIGRTVKRIGLPGFEPKPDYDKLQAAMDKAHKPLEWEFTFDTAKFVFTVQADIGGTAVVLGKADLMAEKDLRSAATCCRSCTTPPRWSSARTSRTATSASRRRRIRRRSRPRRRSSSSCCSRSSATST